MIQLPPEFLDPNPADRRVVTDLLARDEPDDEEHEEEGDGKEDGDDDQDDEGYSE